MMETTNLDSAIMHGIPALDTIPEDASARASTQARANAAQIRVGWMSSNTDSSSAEMMRDGSEAAGSEAFSTKGVIDNESPNSPEGPADGGVTEERPVPHHHRPSPRDPDQVLKCRPKMSWKMWVILGLLACGVAVGIYFIVDAVQSSTTPAAVAPPALMLSPSPTVIITDDFLPTDMPSEPPSHPPSMVPTSSMQPSFPLDDSSQATLEYLELLMGDDVYDPDNPQGEAMYFIIYTDQQKVRLDTHGEDRVTQRYMLSYFYYSLNGERWMTDNFLNDAHECEWEGITCPDDNVLNRISLQKMNLVGRLPTEMPYLSSLQYMWLFKNDLQGRIPETFFEFPGLLWLDVSENDLTGSLPASVWEGPDLKVFHFHNNWINGQIPEPTDNTTSITLVEFDASKNLLTGQVPASLWGLTNLTKLYLDNNRFTGIMPPVPDDALVRNLEVLWLQDNNLQGTLPESLVSLPSLENIRFGSNQFVGSIPESWFQMETLQFLGLAANQLTGTIPSDLGNANAITHLKLNNNSLSGNLPDSLPQSISTAWFQHNAFMGMIPPDFGVGRQNLTVLDLEGNMLTGSISTSLCSKVTVKVDCTDDTAPFHVQCSCCAGC